MLDVTPEGTPFEEARVCPGCGRLGMLPQSRIDSEYVCPSCRQAWHIEDGCAWRTTRDPR